MSRRLFTRGINLPLVMGVTLVLFTLVLALHSNLRQARNKLDREKHRAAATWLAVSGADVAEARLRKGTLRIGELLNSPQLQQGRFVVKSRRVEGRLLVESTGYAAREQVVVTKVINEP